MDALCKNSVAQEIYGRDSKHSLFQVNEETVLFQTGENPKKMVLMCLHVLAEDEEVIQVIKSIVRVPNNMVDLLLETILHVSQPKRKTQKLEEAGGGHDGYLLNVGWVHRNFQESFPKINLPINSAPADPGSEVHHIWQQMNI